jgi:four helix bundle protein
MKYSRFEDLPVWNAAAQLGARLIDWTDDAAFRRTGDLLNQLQRAALSVSNNIAEGFERGTTKELVNFLYYSKGSAGEVRSMLVLMRTTTKFCDAVAEINELHALAESISRQLNRWIQSLQQSEIEGPKFLTDQSRQDYERDKRRQATIAELRRWRDEFEAKLKAQATQPPQANPNAPNSEG